MEQLSLRFCQVIFSNSNIDSLTLLRFQRIYHLIHYNIYQMSQQISMQTKYIIRHQNITQIAKPVNMFMNIKKYETSFEKVQAYFVVGDMQFKKKYCAVQNNNTINSNSSNYKNIQDTNINTTYLERTKTVDDTFNSSKLPKFRQFQVTRQHRTLQKFYDHKEKQKKISNYLRNRIKRFGNKQQDYTLTYNQQQIQIFPNPQLACLINDNIPEYWKNSLRDNEKRLKRHIKGNTFQRQVAEQMLQTYNGRKRLTQSIPKIKSQYLENGRECKKSTMKTIGRKTFARGDQMRQIKNRTMTQPIQMGSVSKLFGEQVYKTHYDYSFHH